jgi:hypothetical protein
MRNERSASPRSIGADPCGPPSPMTFDEHLRRAFDTLSNRIRDEVGGSLAALAGELTEAATADVKLAVDSTTRTAREEARAFTTAAQERLVNAMRAMDSARSLSDVLDALVTCGAREAGRAGLFLVSQGRLRSWRLVGFDSLDAGPAVELPADESGPILEAIKTEGGPTSSPQRSSAPSFAKLPEGRSRFVVPICIGGEPVAVLYADEGADSEVDCEALQWFLELLSRHASRSLEAITAFKAARALTKAPSSTPARPSRSSSPTPVDEDESARRFARLLVSDIRLYQEGAVMAGRRERDLATRLGGEIARARQAYEQRVPAAVRRHADYFQKELVRTLADGDETLLGEREESGN